MRKLRTLIIIFLALAAVSCATLDRDSASSGKSKGNSAIRGAFSGDYIVIKTTERLAGAIDSLTWNGKEFINSYDHGRQLQSASSFNNWGECFNPTEAGSASDGAGSTSTSVLLVLSAINNILFAKTQMAFWLRPGETSPSCGRGEKLAQNKTALSGHVLIKKVTIGFAGIPNVIEHRIQFVIPEQYEAAVFEALTGYMPSDFSKFWSYDLKSKKLASLSDGPGEQDLPVILATPDSKYAMAAYSPDLPEAPGLGYGRWKFVGVNKLWDTVKWNCVFRRNNGVPAGTHSFRCYSIIGTLQDVINALNLLDAHFKN